MYCSKCGNKLEDNSRFCDNCGEKISETDRTNKSVEYAPEIKLPNTFYSLIQVSCIITIISFFMPWLKEGSLGINGYDLMSLAPGWYGILVITPLIAGIGVSIILILLYKEPNKLKSFFSMIEMLGTAPIIAVAILYFKLNMNDSSGIDLKEIVGSIGIGGWGTIIGLIGINLFTARLYKEGLKILGFQKELDAIEPGLIEQIAEGIKGKPDTRVTPGQVADNDIQLIRDKVKQVIPENANRCVICDEKYSSDWKNTKEQKQTGLCRDCFTSYYNRI